MDWEIKALSKSEIASLTEPSEVLAINLIASSEIFPFSFLAITVFLGLIASLRFNQKNRKNIG